MHGSAFATACLLRIGVKKAAVVTTTVGTHFALQCSMRPAGLALLALSTGALGGIASSVARPEAHADGPGEVTVPVPLQGVVFRGIGGRAVARITSESAGGSFEVLDSRGQVAVRLRALPGGGLVEVATVGSAGAPLRLGGSLGDPGY